MVVLADAVEGHLGVTDIVVIIGRMPGQHRLGKDREIACRGIRRALVGPAVGAAEMAVGHAQPLSLGVHQRHERGNVAARAFGQDDAAIVGRNGHDPLEQLIDADPLATAKEHRRADPVPLLERRVAHGETLVGL